MSNALRWAPQIKPQKRGARAVRGRPIAVIDPVDIAAVAMATLMSNVQGKVHDLASRPPHRLHRAHQTGHSVNYLESLMKEAGAGETASTQM